MNVKIAFLNRELNKEIYMEQLVAFTAKGQEKKVCNLKKIYVRPKEVFKASLKSLYYLKKFPKIGATKCMSSKEYQIQNVN